MAWVATRVTRTSQPQDACGIDWGNPITRGLVFAFNPATGAANLADGKAATTNNTSRRASPDGVFAKGAASQRNIEWANYQPVTTSDGNGTGDFTLVSFSNPPLASGGVSQHIFAQKNDAGGSPFAQVQLAAHYNFTVGAHEEGKFTFAIYSPAGNQIAETPFSIDGNWHMWSGVRSGATMTLRRDVEVLSSTTSAVRSILQAAPRYLALGGQGNTTASALTEGVGYSFAFNRALSDAEIQSLSANPWQVFAPEIVRIWVDDYVSSGAVTGNASGSLSTVSLSPVSGAASGAASASASIRAVSLSAVNGIASGASVASGVFAPISLNAVSATATGSANASATLAPISLSPTTGAANGETVVTGNASGAFDDVAMSPVSGTANGAASATGALSAISLTPINGTASGGAIVAGNAAGAFDDVSLTALTGAASGGSAGIAAGVFASLSINPATGAAYGAAVAVGGLPVIALTPLTGSATGVSIIPAYASGAFDDITLSPLTGTAAVIRRIRPIVPNYNIMSVDASYNVAYIDPTYWID